MRPRNAYASAAIRAYCLSLRQGGKATPADGDVTESVVLNTGHVVELRYRPGCRPVVLLGERERRVKLPTPLGMEF